jgi:shikimate kinase
MIFITGTSTAGKSTVASELQKRGYEAYDTEHKGVSAWYNKQTGKRAAGFGEMPERTKEWLDQYEWLISEGWAAEMASKAKGKPIFLCGGSANEPEIREMCDKVIWLKTNEYTIRQRVNNPRDHDYGTKPHELERAILSNLQKETEYKGYGAIMVDATQPIDKVIEKILSAVV